MVPAVVVSGELAKNQIEAYRPRPGHGRAAGVVSFAEPGAAWIFPVCCGPAGRV